MSGDGRLVLALLPFPLGLFVSLFCLVPLSRFLSLGSFFSLRGLLGLVTLGGFLGLGGLLSLRRSLGRFFGFGFGFWFFGHIARLLRKWNPHGICVRVLARWLLLFALGGGKLPQSRAAIAAESFLASILDNATACSRGAVAPGAEQEHVGNLDRHFLVQPAPLRVFLAPLDVFVDEVYPFHDDGARLAVDNQDLFAQTPVVAGDHFHNVVGFQMHYTTSLARLTIFMNLLSRSSRATAPKMRVPRGLRSLSMSTTALESKRT